MVSAVWRLWKEGTNLYGGYFFGWQLSELKVHTLSLTNAFIRKLPWQWQVFWDSSMQIQSDNIIQMKFPWCCSRLMLGASWIFYLQLALVATYRSVCEINFFCYTIFLHCRMCTIWDPHGWLPGDDSRHAGGWTVPPDHRNNSVQSP